MILIFIGRLAVTENGCHNVAVIILASIDLVTIKYLIEFEHPNTWVISQ